MGALISMNWWVWATDVLSAFSAELGTDVGAILACTLAGSLAANLIFLALGFPPASGFWASFWLVNQLQSRSP